MIHKRISFRRQQRSRWIKHRDFINTHVYLAEPHTKYSRILGKLNKGKVHCSCVLCSGKTRRDRGVRSRSLHSWKISDQNRIESMNAKLDDFEEFCELDIA